MKGTSAYKPLQTATVRFALNVWAGWAPIIFANDGFKAARCGDLRDGQGFKVELILIDNPVAMRDAYATGDVHIGWATLDMVPLFMEGFVDSRQAARQPGDAAHLSSRWTGPTAATASWFARASRHRVSPGCGQEAGFGSELAVALLRAEHVGPGRLQPSEVHLIFTDDAFQAAAAFNANKDIAGVVSWGPDIYNLEKGQGQQHAGYHAGGQQAHRRRVVWLARADLPRTIRAFVKPWCAGFSTAWSR